MTHASVPRPRHRLPAIVPLLVAAFAAATPMQALADAPASTGAPAAVANGHTASPRERVRLDTGWHFHRGDAPDARGRLDYDVRPETGTNADGKDADSRPDAALQLTADRPVLKPWILPTANPLIADPARRHATPAMPPRGSDVSFLQPGFDDSGWEAVTLPHDWAIAGPFLVDGPYGGMGRLPSWGVGWYWRRLDVPAGIDGRSVFLEFDGAMSYTAVWLNGQLVGGWPYGYNSWRVDVTPHLKPGQANTLAVRLDNPPESARWYPGGGLYRDVWLLSTGAVRVAQWGTHVTTTDVSTGAATVRLAVDIENAGDAGAVVSVDTELFTLDPGGKRTGTPVARLPSQRAQLAAGGSTRADASVVLQHPRLWGPPPNQQPHRYVAVTTLRRDGQVVDRYETRFGIRDLRFDPDRGVLVNGEHIPVRGVNQHHDLGALGAAFNVRAAQRQLEILRDMGTNAIRLAHNPPDPQLLELTDAMGLLVIDEVFDSWERKKTPLDFHLVFPDWHEPDLRAMVRRDRNHPSVIAWSVGNEVGEQYTGEEGAAIGRRLVVMVRQEDPTRPTTASANWAKPDMPFAGVFDMVNLNYQGEGIRQDPEFDGTDRIRTPPQYPGFHAAFPDKVILTSESASAASSRGVYLFPVTAASSAPIRDGRGGDSAINQVSAYELHAVDFGASADKVFAALDRHPYVGGEFVWNGFDYLGEPTPYYDARSSYTGIIDLAGFPKDRYWLYQARWRPELPMAHLLPHWTWPGREGQLTPVHVFTSGDEAELFVNGVSQGRKKKDAYTYRLRWDEVVYQPGEIRVQAYRDGNPWASDSVHTAGAPARLQLEVDRARIAGDGRDLAFATVRVLDAAGHPVPAADTTLHFQVDGPATLVATDNGDATDMTAFPSPVRKAFSGMALAIVRGDPGRTGTATLRVSAEGLPAAAADITLVADAGTAPAAAASGTTP